MAWKKTSPAARGKEGQIPAAMRKFIFGDLENSVKRLSWPVYQALIFGPACYLVRNSLAGLVTLEDDMVQSLTRACWDALTTKE